MIRASVLFTLFSLALHTTIAAEPEKPANMDIEMQHFYIVEGHTAPSKSMVFSGNSRIKTWRTIYGAFSPLNVLNRSIEGATIADFTRTAGQNIIPFNPAVIVFYGGDNEIASGSTPEGVSEDFKRFVAKVRTGLPSTPIVFMSLIPSPAHWELWGKMQKANELVRKYIEGRKDLVFIDVSAPFLDKGGVVRSELFLGGRIDLNAEGFRRWAGILKPKLVELEKISTAQKIPVSSARR